MSGHLKRRLTTTQIIAFGFLSAILVGMFFLMLPISSKEGVWTNPVDALFTATTSVCVTGLTTVSTAEHWSVFGQVVILVLIQFGGLGIVTFTTFTLLVIGSRITLKDRLLIRDAYNLDSLNGLVKLTKRVLKGTLIVEGIGALLYMTVFISDYGLNGIFYSVFNSVSAFCNAGMDLIGDSSLAVYRDNVIVNSVTVSLIILGGIGFPVWWDFLAIRKKNRKLTPKSIWNRFELHTKLVLFVTLILLLLGTVLIFAIEYNNPNTIGKLSGWEKLQASFFQSVTTRTAGFYTIPQENFTDASAFVSLILMFIGGSPSGTAGGIKTVTVAMIILTAVAIVRNKQYTEVFGRSISSENVRKGIAVIVVSVSMLVFAMGALCIIEQKDFLDTLYETMSALATVGLSRGMTGDLSVPGKIVICATMFVGRVGPISLALLFNINGHHGNNRHYPVAKVRVG
ncbi:MAG: potassium transporter KtrB [Lachnospiraceae bacterium]|nr:potassium transporter KtrB [Lachnospiraceae bacterium]